MIDTLKRVARAIQVLRLPSLGVGLVSLASLVVIVLFFTGGQGDRLIIPLSAGWLWGLSTYSFIVTFRAVPDKPNAPLKFSSKLKHIISRLWYGLVSLFFLGATAAMLVVTIRMVSIWLRDHGG
ncbi:hypothetical protein [Desulfosarcina sp.]|uniref:hypothetical protein n=1 Tax=Desulfosarcina sp. TaxID=2027861 RepID=UPI00356853C3